MQIPNSLKKLGIEQAVNYLEKDPEKNLPKLMDWVDWFSKGNFPSQRAAFREAIVNPAHCYHDLVYHVVKDIDPGVLKSFFVNFFLNANLIGWPKQDECREKYHCNVPWTILLDPTSACNLHCTGCWAAEYGNKLNLTYDEIDDIIRQGKEMGIYMYIYTGGEPLVRKADIIRLCEKHSDCTFLSFTNATLIDEAFADDMLRVKNFIPAISLEGFEEATDARRGKGTYQKVIQAMELLKRKKLPYGISCCYTRQNMDSITSEAYYDKMIELGALFVWYFHYMPIGNDAVPELMPTPEQREYIYHKIRHYRSTKPLFAMDFQNDAEYVGGCIAGGRRYLHINANGDIDPCVFIHYSDSNIRKKTLLEALTSPMFMAYHDGQPFNKNMLRPCPMLENPEKIYEMVQKTGAPSTDLQSPESVEHLCSKTVPYAENWTPVADRLWEERKHELDEKAEKVGAASGSQTK
ncbi:MAG: radical SAM protein [Intestinimonas sp.]|jgi:MoaA/NifB/PqqE/SkfB family radical SAM enzyme|nr:radical SAM protein [Intestinimonas sp.]